MVFRDEVHFRITTSVTRKRAVRGSAPKVAPPPGRKSVAYSGYVIPETGGLIVTKPGRFNCETVIGSIRGMLAELGARDGKRVRLVLDNAPRHRKAAGLTGGPGDEYADIRERVDIVNLPPYSPDLNPIEQVWRVTRREVTHNRYFPDETALAAELDAYFAQFRGSNEKLSRLCSFKYKK